MIFTRRFGALAARPVFPAATEIQDVERDVPAFDDRVEVDEVQGSAA